MQTLKKTYKRAVIAALMCGVLAPATAAHELREQLSVIDPVIKLGDLFTDAGAAAETIVMEAPAPGKAKQLSSYELERIANQFELDWERPTYLKRIRVYREGNSFTLDDLNDIVMAEIQAQGLTSDVEVQIYGRRTGLYLPADATANDVEIESFEMSDRRDRFNAVVLIPTGGVEADRLSISGRIEEVRMVPTLNRILTPGEVIRKSDIEWIKFPVRQINARVVLDQAELVGLVVKRAVRPGKTIFSTDVALPVVVEKGSIVTMIVSAGALSLTASGRALENGGDGDTIRVMNTKSKQTVDAKVLNSGQVQVSSNSLTLAAM
ncbi:flagellar basal body P-ring formation chaperone FlgA [Kordiimonas sp.]|uniref:flagellar basal body P-ring formation chaperone FlgA n=1 Tax=Kordiimonas sp. TaxID=1970157 RepID=UPI003A93E53D